MRPVDEFVLSASERGQLRVGGLLDWCTSTCHEQTMEEWVEFEVTVTCFERAVKMSPLSAGREVENAVRLTGGQPRQRHATEVACCARLEASAQLSLQWSHCSKVTMSGKACCSFATSCVHAFLAHALCRQLGWLVCASAWSGRLCQSALRRTTSFDRSGLLRLSNLTRKALRHCGRRNGYSPLDNALAARACRVQ